MKDFINIEENKIYNAIKSLGYDIDQVKLLPSDFADYQYNGIMSLAKICHKNPREIASEVVERLDKENIESISVEGPGFINITFKNESLFKYFNDYKLSAKEKNNNKIVMDYGGPNVAKVLHVGHLRSANIGQALKNLARFLGNEVIADVHLGDFGRPLGLVILELKKRHPDWVFFDESYVGNYPKVDITNKELEELYPIASIKGKDDEEYLEEARLITIKLQNKEKGYYDLWKQIVKVSTDNIKYLYNKLNVDFDLWLGESDADDYIKTVIDYFKAQGVTKESEGALVVEVKKEDDNKEMPPLLLVKSNKSVSYETTDLATIYDRVNNIKPNEIWYVVDNRQSLHFEQVFRASYLSNMVDKNTKLSFLGFGTMNGSDGKPFKTRDGGVMTLEKLIELVKEETLKKINFEGEEKNKIADILSVAALKYADLLPIRTTDYIFDIEKFCDLNGKTGVYLLYSIVRMKSLLKKSLDQNIKADNISKILGDSDREILVKLLQVDSILTKSYEDKSLNYITDYLYQLAKTFNSFYDSHKILNQEDEDLQKSWVCITKKICQVMETLTTILGIEIPEKM